MSAKNKQKLTRVQVVKALANVAKTTYQASPMAVVAKLFGAIITAVVPIVTTYFAAQTTTLLAAGFAGDERAGEQAIWYVIATATLGILSSVWYSVQSYITELTSYRINAAMSDKLYEHFVSIEYWRYDDKETADMFDKAQEFAMFFARFFDIIARIVGSVVEVVVGVATLFFVDVWIGVLIVVAVIPGVIVQFKISRLQSQHWNENTEVRRKANGITWSLFRPANLAELRVYNVAKYMLNLRAKYRELDQLERIGFERKYMGKRLIGDIIEAVAQLIALLSIARQIITHSQPLGQFILVQQMTSRAIGGMHSLASEFNGIDTDLATMVDYETFMQLPTVTKGTDALPEPPKEIVLSGLSFAYPNAEQRVLHDINMTIKAGQHIAIVGENGAGKSTLVKLLLGLYKPAAGYITVDGRDLATIDEDEWHRHLGVLQQDFIHYYFATVRENIEYGDTSRPPDKKRFAEALDHAEATKFVDKLPRKADTIPNQWFEHDDGTNGVELSGGQWQRLALARNFYRQAPIIILDEPTSAIDALAESRIFNRLFSDHGNTIIAVSHRLTTIKKADVVYMMKDGRIVEQGTTAELIAKKGEFYHMFESQI